MRWVVFALTLISCAFAVSEESQDVIDYEVVSGWIIRIDPSVGYGCFAVKEFSGDTILRIGIDKLDGGMYLAVADMDWKSLEAGKEYRVSVAFGDEEPWTGDATGVDFDGLKALWLGVDEDSGTILLTEFMQESTIEVLYQNESIAMLSLSGSFTAGETLIECQTMVNESGIHDYQSDDDPFAKQPASQRDPFAT